MTWTWEEPEDWMDWVREFAADKGVDIDAPIIDVAGNWSRPNHVTGNQRYVIYAREVAIRNNELKAQGDDWEPNEEQSVRIWMSAVAILPMKVKSYFSQGERDDICSMASSLLWTMIKRIDKMRLPIMNGQFIRQAISAARKKMSDSLSVPAELWGDVSIAMGDNITRDLFTANPAWLAEKNDRSQIFYKTVTELVDTWVTMLGLVASAKTKYTYERPGQIDRHKRNYRDFVLNSIRLTRRLEEWQEGRQKN